MSRRAALRPLPAALLALALVQAGSGAHASEPACKPGTGPHLTQQKLTRATFESPADVRCAYLVEADLDGFDLVQVDLSGADLEHAHLEGADLGQADLSGADLRNADLKGAELTQATLTGADFTGADLNHAKLVQVDAAHTNFTGADLSGADVTQGTLTDARLDGARLSRTSFTQAELGGASWAGVKGIAPWNTFVLVFAGIVFVLLAALVVRSGIGSGARSGSGPVSLGLIGALIVGVGVFLFFGGFIGELGTAPPLDQTCTGALCGVGLQSGVVGILAGLVAVMGGLVLIARRG